MLLEVVLVFSFHAISTCESRQNLVSELELRFTGGSVSVRLQIIRLFFSLEKELSSNRRSAEPAAAEDEVTVVEHSGLAGSDGALRRVEGHARDAGVQRLDGGGSRLVLVADFGEGT
jgi:hypothetical protein